MTDASPHRDAALEATDMATAPPPAGAAASIGAIFDVDGTLLPGTTAERLFLRFLARRGELDARAAWQTAWFVARRLYPPGLAAVRGVREGRPYLAGKEVAAMERLGAECFAAEIRPRLSAQGVAAVHAHRDAGRTTALLSGGLWFLVEPMAAWLGANHALATRLATRVRRGGEPTLTATLTGPHPYGAAKATLLRAFADRHGLDLARSFCYGNHRTDTEMLALVGHPVAVNPDTALRREATRRGWPIEVFA